MNAQGTVYILRIYVLNLNIYLIKNWMSCHVENVNLYIPLFNCDPVETLKNIIKHRQSETQSIYYK